VVARDPAGESRTSRLIGRHPYLARWPAGIESVRRGTSATTVGPPEPFSDLLADTGGG
jgi:hypothetical protein